MLVSFWKCGKLKVIKQPPCLRAAKSHRMLDHRTLIGTLVIGLIVGAIAKLLMPGRDPGGCIITMLLGIAGSFVGTWLGKMFTGNENYTAHWIMSIVGAMLLLFIYRLIAGKRS